MVNIIYSNIKSNSNMDVSSISRQFRDQIKDKAIELVKIDYKKPIKHKTTAFKISELTEIKEIKLKDVSIEDLTKATLDSILSIIKSNEENDTYKRTLETNKFCSVKKVNLSFDQFLARIVKYTKMEKSTLILANIFIDRYCQNKNFHISSYSIYK